MSALCVCTYTAATNTVATTHIVSLLASAISSQATKDCEGFPIAQTLNDAQLVKSFLNFHNCCFLKD